MPKDYYETLNVSRSASPDEIKAAYRKQALKYHPDRNQGNKSTEEKFKQVNEAYSVLSDHDKRSRYDQFGHAGVSDHPGAGGAGFGASGFDFGGLGDMFGDIFQEAFGGGRRRRRSQHAGRDLRADHDISLDEVLTGTEAHLNIPNYIACVTCKGSGAKSGTGKKKCPLCRGHGQVRVSQGFFTMTQTCSQCQGYGEIIEHPCTTCHGSGRTQKTKSVRVKIPGGIEDGTTLRIGGSGEAGQRGAPAGDLYVVVRVRPDKRFERDGGNLYSQMNVPFTIMALGGEIEVPSLEGKVRLKIPAGTQAGTQFRVGDHGVPFLKSRGRGDLYVQVQVEVPKKLTKEEKKILNELHAKLDGKKNPKDESVFRKVFGK